MFAWVAETVMTASCHKSGTTPPDRQFNTEHFLAGAHSAEA